MKFAYLPMCEINRWSYTVWPDVGIKRSRIFPNVAKKATKFCLKSNFLKQPKRQPILGQLVLFLKLCLRTLKTTIQNHLRNVSQGNVFLNGPTPASFLFIFGLFKQTIQFLQQINVKNVMPIQYMAPVFEPTTS